MLLITFTVLNLRSITFVSDEGLDSLTLLYLGVLMEKIIEVYLVIYSISTLMCLIFSTIDYKELNNNEENCKDENDETLIRLIIYSFVPIINTSFFIIGICFYIIKYLVRK